MEKESKVECKKKNKILIIFLVIMVVIVLGLVGYIVWDKVLRDVEEDKPPVSTIEPTPTIDVTPDMTPSPEEEEVEVSLELADELIDMIYDDINCGSELFSYYRCDLVTSDTFSDYFKSVIIAQYLYNRDSEEIMNGTKDPVYSAEEIYAVKDQIFGSNASYDIVLTNGCGEFKTIENGNYRISTECGNMCGATVITNNTKAVQKGDKIYITQDAAFFYSWTNSDESMTAWYYPDYNHSTILYQKEFRDSEDYMLNVHTFDWNQYANQTSVYQYTFQVNANGTYTFVQLERLK